MSLYKYDIPVGFPPGITFRERIVARGRQSFSRESYSWWKPYRDVISILLYRTNTNTKGGKLQTPEILDKYSSSALLN